MATLNAGRYATMSDSDKLAYAMGGIVVAGLLYLVLALLFKLVGAQKVMRFFPPIVTGPMIILIGLNLPSAMPAPAGGWRWWPSASSSWPTSGARAW
jgi:uracil permease